MMKPTDSYVVNMVREHILKAAPERRGNGGPARSRSALPGRILITLKALEAAGFAVCIEANE